MSLVTYQVQPGFSIQGKQSHQLIELESTTPGTSELEDEGAISETIDLTKVPVPNSAFMRFRELIEGDPLFFKVYDASKNNPSVETAKNLVTNAIDNRSLRNFSFAIQDVVDEMDAVGMAFTPSEIDQVNAWLTEAGFSFEVSNP